MEDDGIDLGYLVTLMSTLINGKCTLDPNVDMPATPQGRALH